MPISPSRGCRPRSRYAAHAIAVTHASEIVVDERNGVIVPAADAPALATGMLGLLRDPARARQLGLAGRDWALREASVQAMAARYDALYRGGDG